MADEKTTKKLNLIDIDELSEETKGLLEAGMVLRLFREYLENDRDDCTLLDVFHGKEKSTEPGYADIPGELFKFLDWITEEHQDHDGPYSLEVMPANSGGDDEETILKGYVAVLWVEKPLKDENDELIEEGTIIIQYDVRRLVRHVMEQPLERRRAPMRQIGRPIRNVCEMLGIPTGRPKFEEFSRNHAYRKFYLSFNNVLTKILLHESAHIKLHLGEMISIRENVDQVTGNSFRLQSTAEHEKEAWTYSLAWWAIAMGEKSVYWRTQQGISPDQRVDHTWRCS